MKERKKSGRIKGIQEKEKWQLKRRFMLDCKLGTIYCRCRASAMTIIGSKNDPTIKRIYSRDYQEMKENARKGCIFVLF